LAGRGGAQSTKVNNKEFEEMAYNVSEEKPIGANDSRAAALTSVDRYLAQTQCPTCAAWIGAEPHVCAAARQTLSATPAAAGGSSAKAQSADAPKRTLCPFCAEEISEGAIRCKHCRSDLVKQCPACKEQINAQAVRCKKCGADFGATRTLPFPPIAGATPTSGLVFFFVAFIVLVLSVGLGPFGPFLLLVCTSTWVGFDAGTHKLGQYQNPLGGPASACVGSFLLWIVVFPWYLAIRSRIRAGVQPLKAS
jgi:hypothetical protein